MTLERLQTTREDQAMWGQSGFGQEYDVSTPTGALSALPTGLVYLLFAPFPWAVSGLRQALVAAGDARVVRAHAGLRPRARLSR